MPLTEVGALIVNGREVAATYVPGAGDAVEVRAHRHPQRVPGAPLRFLLDVHLGTLARGLRLLGVDAAYESTDLGDPALAALSAAGDLGGGVCVRHVARRPTPGSPRAVRAHAGSLDTMLRAAGKDEVADRLQQGRIMSGWRRSWRRC